MINLANKNTRRELVMVIIIFGIVVLAAAMTPAAAGDVRLIEAVKQQNRAAIRELVRARTDVNATEPDGTTALHWAVWTSSRRHPSWRVLTEQGPARSRLFATTSPSAPEETVPATVDAAATDAA